MPLRAERTIARVKAELANVCRSLDFAVLRGDLDEARPLAERRDSLLDELWTLMPRQRPAVEDGC
jgi:hypothetical protein